MAPAFGLEQLCFDLHCGLALWIRCFFACQRAIDAESCPLHSARVARKVVFGLVMFVSSQGVSGDEEQPSNM